MKRRFVLVRVLSAFAFIGIANAASPLPQQGPVVQTASKEEAAKDKSSSNQGDDQQAGAKNNAGKGASEKVSQDSAHTWGNGSMRGNDPRFAANPFGPQGSAPRPGKKALDGGAGGRSFGRPQVGWWGDSYWRTTRNQAKWDQQGESAAQ